MPLCYIFCAKCNMLIAEDNNFVECPKCQTNSQLIYKEGRSYLSHIMFVLNDHNHHIFISASTPTYGHHVRYIDLTKLTARDLLLLDNSKIFRKEKI